MSGTKRKSVVSEQTNGAVGLRRALGTRPDWSKFHRLVVDGVPFPIYVRVDERPDGEIVCSGLIIGVEPIGAVVRAADLRLPLAQILTDMKLTLELLVGGVGGWTDKAVPAVTRIRPGRKGRGDDFYKELATRYRKAMQVQPAAPTKLLMGEYRVSGSKIAYWVHEARKRDLLGKSVPGKAGEGRTTRRRKTK